MQTNVENRSCRTCRFWQHHPLRTWYCGNMRSPEYLEPKNRPADVCWWWESKHRCIDSNARVLSNDSELIGRGESE